MDSCLITPSSKLKDINHIYYRIWRKENLQEASKYDNSKLRGPNSYLVQKGDNTDISTSCYIKVWPEECRQLPDFMVSFVSVWNTKSLAMQSDGWIQGLVLSSPEESRYRLAAQHNSCLHQTTANQLVSCLSRASEHWWLNCEGSCFSNPS